MALPVAPVAIAFRMYGRECHDHDCYDHWLSIVITVIITMIMMMTMDMRMRMTIDCMVENADDDFKGRC